MIYNAKEFLGLIQHSKSKWVVKEQVIKLSEKTNRLAITTDELKENVNTIL